MVRYLILALLRDGAPRHGYALMKEYWRDSGAMIGVGNFYRELHRLTASGWVRMATRSPASDPRRLPYAITPAGAAALDRWLAAPPPALSMSTPDAFSVRAFVVARAGATLPGRVLEGWQDELALRQHVLEREGEAIASRRSAVLPSLVESLLTRRLKQISADLALVEQLRTACSTWRTTPPSDLADPPPGPRVPGRPAALRRGSTHLRPV